MKQIFTQKDLIRFLYGETDPVESDLIKEALFQDFELQNTYLELKATKNELDSVSYEPAQTSVDIILKHSQSLESTLPILGR